MIALALVIAVIIGTTFTVAAERRGADKLLDHTFEVLLASGELETAINLNVRGERGYLLTGNEDFLAPYAEGRARALEQIEVLARLTRDNPVQKRNLAVIAQRIAVYLRQTEHLVNLERVGRHDDAVNHVKSGIGRRHINNAMLAVAAFDAEELRLLAERRARQERFEGRNQALLYLLAAAGALLLILLAVAIVTAAYAHRRTLDLARELQVQATTDALTRLPNRRHVIEALEKEIHRAVRSERPLALALLDLDRFKLINDTHGHPSGDAVLCSIADILRRVCRNGDIVGRFGGEEFAVLMPETSPEQAELVCERIRTAIAGRTVAFPNGAFGRVTVSTGVAIWGSEPWPKFVARADIALYQAKQDGRNVVRLAA